MSTQAELPSTEKFVGNDEADVTPSNDSDRPATWSEVLGAAVVAGLAGGIGYPLWYSDSKLCGGGLLVVAGLAWFGGIQFASTDEGCLAPKKTAATLVAGVIAIIVGAIVEAFFVG